MKKIVSLLLAGAMIISMTACQNSAQEERPEAANTSERTGSGNTTEADVDAKTEDSTQTYTEAAGEEDSAGNNILVAYFSLAGEQYNVGVIEEGNTSIIAHMIAEQTGADLFEIEAVNPYPDTHSALLDVSRQEMNENARPEIAGTVDNMEKYDTVFIGYPNWWGDMPMIVYNFIESYDFSGKTIVPFCTHGGSGLSGTERTIADMTGATMIDGFTISGETAQNDRDRSRAEVAAWLQEGGFIE